MSRCTLLSALYVLGLLMVTNAQRGGRPCLDAARQSGVCATLRDCPSQYQRLQRGTQQDFSFLQRSHCGFSAKWPLVCCASRQGPVTPPIQPVVTLPSGQPSTTRPSPRAPPRPTTVGRPEPMMMQQCGGNGTHLIIGGEETILGEHPWLVALEYSNGAKRAVGCGGVLISPRYVLTAAHCIRNTFLERLVSVRIGEHNLQTDPDCAKSRAILLPNICAPAVIRVTIERTIRHPQYSSVNTQNDIALIRLREPVAFNQYVSPVCLPGRESLSSNYVGTRQTVTGWGLTEQGIFSNVKLKVTLPVISNERCEELFRAVNENVNLLDTQMCAGGEKLKDSCKGDSGGPLLLSVNTQWTIIGIVSYGYAKCGIENIPAVYTRVAPFLDWINNNMEP